MVTVQGPSGLVVADPCVGQVLALRDHRGIADRDAEGAYITRFTYATEAFFSCPRMSLRGTLDVLFQGDEATPNKQC
jgi:hypothetical protein